jgi:hypothetical protein
MLPNTSVAIVSQTFVAAKALFADLGLSTCWTSIETTSGSWSESYTPSASVIYRYEYYDNMYAGVVWRGWERIYAYKRYVPVPLLIAYINKMSFDVLVMENGEPTNITKREFQGST